MIFAEDMLQAAQKGRKDMTRRLVKPGEYALVRGDTGLIDAVIIAPEPGGKYRIKWQVGKTQPMQPGRGKKSVGRMLITSIERDRFVNISPVDAVREGFYTVEGFYGKIKDLYGETFNLNAECWVITFKLV